MDKRVDDEPTTNDPQPGPNEETAKLFKLLEEAQSPLYPGSEYTVQRCINELMKMQTPDDSVTDECMNEILRILIRALPNGTKLAQFNNMKKINELLRAQVLMQDLKSQGGDAETSKQVQNATTAQEMSRESIRDGAKPIAAAKSGKGKGKGKKALDAGTTPK